MAAASERTPIPNWESHWTDPGSLYALVYRPPPRSVCMNDSRAYSRVQAMQGITGITKGLATPWDTPWRGWARDDALGTWEAWVIITAPGTLGRRLQPRIMPCDGVNAAYELVRVDRVRADSGAILTSMAKLKDKLESPGEAIGGAAAAGVSAVTSQLAEAVLPLTIPLIAAFLIYRAVSK